MKRLGLVAIAVLLMAAPAFAEGKLVVETSKKCSFTITPAARRGTQPFRAADKACGQGFL